MLKLFVYGTLKMGFPRHAAGLGDAPCLGAYRTVERYPMVVAGRWFAPMMLPEPGVGYQVRGELYPVEEAQLSAIDAMESIGRPGNLRVSIDVEPIESGEATTAIAYLKSCELAVPVHSPLLDDYQDRKFIPPWCRK